MHGIHGLIGCSGGSTTGPLGRDAKSMSRVGCAFVLSSNPVCAPSCDWLFKPGIVYVKVIVCVGGWLVLVAVRDVRLLVWEQTLKILCGLAVQ